VTHKNPLVEFCIFDGIGRSDAVFRNRSFLKFLCFLLVLPL